MEGVAGYFLDTEPAIGGRGEQFKDAPFDSARSLAHVITLSSAMRTDKP
jgi:hypothetical protein